MNLKEYAQRTHKKFRSEDNADELSPPFKEWVLKQDAEMKFDMMDTVFVKKDSWMFSRLVELFTATPEAQGGLPISAISHRYL
jgi:hypothetical protein